MQALRAFLIVAALSVISAAEVEAAEPRWGDATRIGPLRGEIAMASNDRGQVMMAWRSGDEIRWRFVRSGVSGRIETSAPDAPAAALNDRGGAVLAWGVSGVFGGALGSLSFAARPPGRRSFRTVRRDIGDDEVYGPPELALAPSGRAAWAWEGFLGVASLGVGAVPYETPKLRVIPSRRQNPTDVSLRWLDRGTWSANWLLWSAAERAALMASTGTSTASLVENRHRWLTLPAPPDFGPYCARVETAPTGARIAAWDDQRSWRGLHQRRIMLAGFDPDGMMIPPRAVTRWTAHDRVACPAVATASDGWAAAAWLSGPSGDKRVRVAIRPPGGTLGRSLTVARGQRATSVDVSVAPGGGVLTAWAGAGARPVRAALLGRRPQTLARAGSHPRAILLPDGTATVTWRTKRVGWLAQRR